MSTYDAYLAKKKEQLLKERERLATPSKDRLVQKNTNALTNENTNKNKYIPASKYGSRSTAGFDSYWGGKTRDKSKSRSKNRKHKKRHQTRKHKK